MKNGAVITVVCGSKIIRAVALKLAPGEGWWWSGEGYSGPLGDEHIHYVRGHLYRWWPPHRKRADALIVAAALGPPVPEPALPKITAATAAKLMNRLTTAFDKDVKKLMGDAERIVRDAEKRAITRTIKSLTRRWP